MVIILAVEKRQKFLKKKNKKVVDKRLQVRYNKQAVAKRQQTGTLIIEQQPSLKIQNKNFQSEHC